MGAKKQAKQAAKDLKWLRLSLETYQDDTGTELKVLNASLDYWVSQVKQLIQVQTDMRKDTARYAHTIHSLADILIDFDQDDEEWFKEDECENKKDAKNSM